MTVERELQDRLHAEICGGDPTASSRAFTTLLDPLIDALGFKWPHLRGTERLHDFAVDSIMTYVQEPARYDPSKSALLTYLRMDAHGDLLNEHARLERARAAEAGAAVEIADEQRKGSTDEFAAPIAPPPMARSALCVLALHDRESII